LREKGRIGSLLLLTAVTTVCYAAIKVGLAFAPPLRFAGLRALVAGTALLLVLAIRRGTLLPSPRNYFWLIALALVGTTITFGAMFLSPAQTGAGIASVLGNTQPLAAVILAALFLGERLTRDKALALVLGFAGISLIAYPALRAPSAQGFSGALLALAASAGAAAASVLFKRRAERESLLTVATWQLFLGGPPLLLFSAVVERDKTIVWNFQFTGLLLFLALAGTSLTTILWYWLIREGTSAG